MNQSISSEVPADLSCVQAGCSDTYLVDYLFELNGYLIVKGAVSGEDIAEMNAWANAHWEYMDGTRRGGHGLSLIHI